MFVQYYTQRHFVGRINFHGLILLPGLKYAHHGEVLCEYCLIGKGISTGHADYKHTHIVTEIALYRAGFNSLD